MCRLTSWLRILTLCALSLCVVAGQAAEPATLPIPRVETGMHTTLIRRLVVDAPRGRIVTASDDKTVRVWQAPEMRLVSVLRPPIDKGHEGQIFGLAVTPDGRTVAVAGWTGWDWDGSASVYLFDASSGELTGRIPGFADGISALAFTADGSHLVVGLEARSGLHVVRMSDRKVVASDREYNDKIMDLHALPDGRIFSVALDGMVRLYGADFRIAGRRVLAGGKQPSSVRVSPDGTLAAIGFLDKPGISVLGTRDLALAFTPDLAAAAGQVSFESVAWSSDGAFLYAGGEYRGAGQTSLYRWGAQGKGKLEKFPLARERITDVQQYAGGTMAFAAEDPGVGLFTAAGKRSAWRGPEVADFRDIGERLLLAENGATVRFALMRGGEGGLQTFALEAGGEQLLGRESRTPVFGPLQKAAEFRVEGWQHTKQPTINGNAPQLDDYETAHCYAIAHDRKSVLLGTEWALRLLDKQAAQLWAVKLPAVVRGVNIARDGSFAVAALSDGTLRWYRMTDGREVLALFPLGSGKEWIAWTPDGYYVSSVLGDNYIGWHLNRGRDAAADFFRAVQFDRILYRPDAVLASFREARQPGTRKLAASADFEIARLREIAPPRVRLRAGAPEVASGRGRVKLQLDAEKTGMAMRDVTVFVNNIPVTPARERAVGSFEGSKLARTLTLDLAARENTIRVEAFNGVSMGVAETFVALPDSAPLARETGELWLLAVGVNEFAALPSRNWLAFAARDAQEFSRLFETGGSGVFRKVHTRLLADGAESRPTRAGIVSALEFLKDAKPEDTVVIFLASHGLSDPAGNYYFVPADAQSDDLTRVSAGQKAESLLPWTAFFDALRGVPGRRVLFVDTCQAKNIEGKFEAHALIKRSASSLFSIVVAAKGDEESQEYAAGRHGLFTYAILNAAQPGADKNGDKLISLRELFDAARPTVEKLRSKSVGPQTPQLIAPDPLGDLPLFSAQGR